MSINIVLVEPEIPQNTGNIIRTCAATGAKLHLVRPLGFSMDNKYLKRAGLDYWDLADVQYYDNFDELKDKNKNAKFFYATTKTNQNHSDVKYEKGCFIVFGKETKGLPVALLDDNKETCIRVPMRNIERARSLNLSNSVAIVAYEALRQIGYPDMR
ncbi:MAG: tRNA (uridine(34)/cytosine(34)/5-carboxymethylaminomethyluridine(34)-2'-O)-methyltransferase TrmL [Tepidibacter sp.]|jgi:tRNA (cytidine/uridine-2'-O-)-methyltransferase|uniref:tRNA (uridine(34)/cytosine(34)/5- carboxymethylaminomethyluridine(34)-2'-O)- methyltransferase TrmL n=1 Tax=Tepidibacter sp. TaxID=2529387 RepID=UPI0025F76B6F|nr:tRNA (uridine(34)/cytosine(34)/5-carboxymethylaminomethyluridine(34)-2'-O)-methyltransferase TrmL [Tepidibacter sp.]MCT4508768.1 tRNA (uridine(34)/cytosine(34)/5-carboxymethylaminomethyluridine(34)-2'-O)-methyltransferase TrmL [Tepidibacter sp.]